VAGRVCTQCGGPLDADTATCPWCGTPVEPATRVVVRRENPTDFGIDDDSDDDLSGSGKLTGGVFLLAVSLLLLSVAAWLSVSCGSGEPCSEGSAFWPAFVGGILLLVAIGILVSWYRGRRASDDF
jgi:hypothetical protein